MDTPEELRQQHVTPARRVVVKIGTNLLTGQERPIDSERIANLVEQVAEAFDDGREVAVVSSGSIGAGMAGLNMTERPRTLPHLQATASVGQGKLVGEYDRQLRPHDLHAAQILLTRDDFESRRRYLNAANTINTLFDLSCVPIINENDTISTEEIKFGDNDYLAAYVTHLIRAELLVLLTSVPGLCRGDPAAADRPDVISVVEEVNEDVEELAVDRTSPGGAGGMKSKLDAARIATRAGEAAVIADGRGPDCLRRVLSGENTGTLFLPAEDRLSSYKRWLRFTRRPQGTLVVDEGARDALQHRGTSLLPSGITAVRGGFEPGDTVRVCTEDGREVARGLSNYSSSEVKKIMGLQTDDIEEALGYKDYDEVLHRDNLALST